MSLITSILVNIPQEHRLYLKMMLYFPAHVLDRIRGKRVGLPPRWMIFDSGPEFEKVGELFLDYAVKLANLKSDSAIADVGCGIGRIAIPLAKYVENNGSYHGFDVDSRAIRWCQQNIHPKQSNIVFTHSNIRNNHYNRRGTENGIDYEFPMASGSCDFVISTSVFTHLVSDEAKHYLAEISRILKPGGRCLITWFLINPDSEKQMKDFSSTLQFDVQVSPSCYSISRDNPEAGIAFEEEYVLEQYSLNKLAINGAIHYGSWSGRQDHTSYQDMIIAEKCAVEG